MNTDKLSATIPEGANALDLVLTGKWWEAWNKDKQEDYRELTNYWITRLIGKDATFTNCNNQPREDFEVYDLISRNPSKFLYFNKAKPFTHIRLSKGYQKYRPTGYVEFGGIEIREGKTEWGAKEGRLYFCIMRKGYKVL